MKKGWILLTLAASCALADPAKDWKDYDNPIVKVHMQANAAWTTMEVKETPQSGSVLPHQDWPPLEGEGRTPEQPDPQKGFDGVRDSKLGDIRNRRVLALSTIAHLAATRPRAYGYSLLITLPRRSCGLCRKRSCSLQYPLRPSAIIRPPSTGRASTSRRSGSRAMRT